MKSSLVALLKSVYLKPTAPELQISPNDRRLRYFEDARTKAMNEGTIKKGQLSGKDNILLNDLAQKRFDDEMKRIESGGFVSILCPVTCSIREITSYPVWAERRERRRRWLDFAKRQAAQKAAGRHSQCLFAFLY